MTKGKNLWAMTSNLNDQILAALQHVVSVALKDWLDEHKADVLQALRAAVPASHMPPLTNTAALEEKRQPEFLNTADIAARWQLHPESVRRMARQGRLPRMFMARRILVPLSAIVEYERQNTLACRR
jgi:hypothetical protein